MTEIDVLVSEVGPRDGLQSLETIMSTDAKKRWIKAEAAAGVREIEVGSFVPAKLLPQMADTGEIVKYAKTIPGLTVTALVPNFIGAKNAIKAGVDKMCLPLSVSETHSRSNLRKAIVRFLERLKILFSTSILWKQQSDLSLQAILPLHLDALWKARFLKKLCCRLQDN